MSTVAPEDLIAQMQWRYAVKTFDATRVIPAETWAALEETLILTPSSFGLQPWFFLVLTDRALRETLVPHAWGQRQVADCSHFVVFCSRRDLGESEIDAHLRRVSDVRGTPPEKLTGYRQAMVSALLEGRSAAWIEEWAARQVYIALGNFMTSAAVLGVDTCPMEGFEPDKFDDLLQLKERRLSSVVCCAVGYRSSEDRYARIPKVRFPRDATVAHR